MTIQEKAYCILGHKLVSGFDSKDMVKWALKALVEGYESEALYILAGLDLSDTEERSKYFYNSLADLKIDSRKPDSELIRYYAIAVAQKVLATIITPESGLRIMLKISGITDYSPTYMQFEQIDHDIDYLGSDELITNNILHLQKGDYIFQEFEIFLDLIKLGLDEIPKKEEFCMSCGKSVKTKLKPFIKFLPMFKTSTIICSNCDSKDVFAYYTQIGRRGLINNLAKAKKY